MNSIHTRIITVALATLALTASAAVAQPVRDQPGVSTSSLAGTTSPPQDLRNPDQRAPAPPAGQTLRSTGIAAAWRTPVGSSAPADDDGPSPLVYILPAIVLLATLGTGVAYARLSRDPARA